MKTTISIPDHLYDSVNAAARRLHLSRSRFFAIAVSRYLDAIRSEGVTERLNAVYGELPSVLPKSLAHLQTASTLAKIGCWTSRKKKATD